MGNHVSEFVYEFVYRDVYLKYKVTLVYIIVGINVSQHYLNKKNIKK